MRVMVYARPKIARHPTFRAFFFTNHDDARYTLLKDGAWDEIRLRGSGQMTAWHKGKIQWEGRWEILDPRTIRIAFRDAIGLVLNFDGDVNSFKALNESTIQGKRLGRAPVPHPVVGRWRWNGREIRNIREDGTISSNGTWQTKSAQLEVTWDKGVWIDTLRLSSDGKKMTGRNQKGHEVHAERVPVVID